MRGNSATVSCAVSQNEGALGVLRDLPRSPGEHVFAGLPGPGVGRAESRSASMDGPCSRVGAVGGCRITSGAVSETVWYYADGVDDEQWTDVVRHPAVVCGGRRDVRRAMTATTDRLRLTARDGVRGHADDGVDVRVARQHGDRLVDAEENRPDGGGAAQRGEDLVGGVSRRQRRKDRARWPRR